MAIQNSRWITESTVYLCNWHCHIIIDCFLFTFGVVTAGGTRLRICTFPWHLRKGGGSHWTQATIREPLEKHILFQGFMLKIASNRFSYHVNWNLFILWTCGKNLFKKKLNIRVQFQTDMPQWVKGPTEPCFHFLWTGSGTF